MKKRDIPLTDYAVMAALNDADLDRYLLRHCSFIPEKSLAPAREHAGAAFPIIGDMFTTPAQPLEAALQSVRRESNSVSRTDNVEIIKAIYRRAPSLGLELRRHDPAPVRFGTSRVLRSLTRHVGRDSKGLVFPVAEPRISGDFTREMWGTLASFHKVICPHGDYRDGRVAIWRFALLDKNERTRSLEILETADLPQISRDALEAAVARIDARHEMVYRMAYARWAEREEGKRRDDGKKDLFD